MGEGSRHVLVIPRAGDPHKLLHEGPCGGRPPVVHEGACECYTTTLWTDRSTFYVKCPACHEWVRPTNRKALPLVWEGEVVPEGMDRAWRRYDRANGALCASYDVQEAEELAGWMQSGGAGTSVMIPYESEGAN